MPGVNRRGAETLSILLLAAISSCTECGARPDAPRAPLVLTAGDSIEVLRQELIHKQREFFALMRADNRAALATHLDENFSWRCGYQLSASSQVLTGCAEWGLDKLKFNPPGIGYYQILNNFAPDGLIPEPNKYNVRIQGNSAVVTAENEQFMFITSWSKTAEQWQALSTLQFNKEKPRTFRQALTAEAQKR